MKALNPVLLTLVLTGCFTEDGYTTTLSASYCSRAQECNEDGFDDAYDNKGECVDNSRDVFNDFRDCAVDAGCEYNADEAAACDKAMRTSSCDEFQNSSWLSQCDKIYDCSFVDVVQGAACLLGFDVDDSEN